MNENKKVINTIFIVIMFLLLSCYFTNIIYAETNYPPVIYVGETFDLTPYLGSYMNITSIEMNNTKCGIVDEDGLFTAHQPGIVEFDIFYKDFSNDDMFAEVTLIIYLPPGVYRIMNKNTGEYLSIANINFKQDPSLKLSPYSNTGSQMLSQLWTLTTNGSHERFNIKPYLDNDAVVCYHATTNDIRIEKIKKYDTEFLDYDYCIWEIGDDEIYNMSFFHPRLTGSNYGGNTGNNDTWVYQLVNPTEYGIKLIDENYENQTNVQLRYMSLNSTKSLEDLEIRYICYGANITDNVIWSSSNDNIVCVDSQTGKVTAKSPGTVSITVTQPGWSNNNSQTYSIHVLPFEDGLYNLTNKYGNVSLSPYLKNGVTYLKRYISGSNDCLANWYLQATIEGKYIISLADDKKSYYDILNVFRESENNILKSYGILSYSNGMTKLPTWKIRENELGYSIEYEGNSNDSLCILDSDDSILELTYPDYEDYESMWNLSKIPFYNKSCKVYIHPYYDTSFIEQFGSEEEMLIALNGALLNAKTIFENELSVQVVVLEPLPLPQQYYTNNGDNNPESAFDDYLTDIGMGDIYIRNMNKYILFTSLKDRSSASYPSGIAFCSIKSSSTWRYFNDTLKYTTLHELGHTLGAKDHYHEIKDDGTCKSSEICTDCGDFELKRSHECVYNEQNYNPDDPFCNECRMDMLLSLYNRNLE